MGLQELLDLPPAEGGLVDFFIAHFIARFDGVRERCLNGVQHKFDEDRGLARVVGGVDGGIVVLLAVMDDRFHREPGEGGVPPGEK